MQKIQPAKVVGTNSYPSESTLAHKSTSAVIKGVNLFSACGRARSNCCVYCGVKVISEAFACVEIVSIVPTARMKII